MGACLKEVAKRAVYSIQPTQLLEANHQIFGFRGYVCEKCLTIETHSVASHNAEGEGRIEDRHFSHPVKVAAASELAQFIDRALVLRTLHTRQYDGESWVKLLCS
jgi:hypothetical protein